MDPALPSKEHALKVLRLAAARYQLGLLRATELPVLAMGALESGIESPAIIELAGEQVPTLRDDGPLFERALQECSIVISNKESAVDCLLRQYLESIALGTIQPREGMRRMVGEIYDPHISKIPARHYVGDQRDLEHLIGAFYSYDDLEERPNQVSCKGLFGAAAITALDEEIRKLAAEWLKLHAE